MVVQGLGVSKGPQIGVALLTTRTSLPKAAESRVLSLETDCSEVVLAFQSHSIEPGR
jgi:hypothetical protein